MNKTVTERRYKALFLYNGERSQAHARVLDGTGHSAGFWGMIHLPENGIDATFVEFEQYVSPRVATFLRKYIFRNIYFLHLPFFFRLLRYDIVFTSSAFGTQLIHALWPFPKPLWVMHDFSITGLIGEGRTRKQRLFRWLVQHSGGIVTVGKEEAEKLKKLFPELRERIAYISFGVDLEFFKPKNVPEDGTILAVGFDPDRDWKTLVEAVRGTTHRVVIATRSSRLAHITLPENVSHRTFTQQELIDAYAHASLIAIPMDTSKGVNDAMGCSTLFEAMAMQKAIVATRTHTFESYITDGENGVLVDEGDVHALRRAFDSLMSDASSHAHLGQKARVYAEEHLNVRVLTAELATFFKKLLVQVW
jgi:glycosyltransferase involved in cell wall biosynthesis